jgi:hypothetical protein
MFIELSAKNLGKLHRSETCSSLRATQGPRTELANEKVRITINIDLLAEAQDKFSGQPTTFAVRRKRRRREMLIDLEPL